ncbi:hypothetical protein IIV31_149L [Armadillidium vulgare iridescent virus]|uniref:Uncharacterized protein n=1 Tax=Armadillidium vulgare iridescent virus TaxID=72201 RepID=A0A068QKM1_9VIRU|nr:hypothetical protein IIV31_149L [Armadillidium vulgare iridescent virus]CCV02521.1 hypothetical protein IIV31_149L [Armadillidium vulgare iridescent virus]
MDLLKYCAPSSMYFMHYVEDTTPFYKLCESKKIKEISDNEVKEEFEIRFLGEKTTSLVTCIIKRPFKHLNLKEKN